MTDDELQKILSDVKENLEKTESSSIMTALADTFVVTSAWKPKFSERGVEWNLQGDYEYFVSTTVIPTLQIINQAINGSGAIVALAITCWAVKTLFRLIKTEYNNS